MPPSARSASIPPTPRLGQRYAFVVVGVIFFCLLFSAGLRATPSVLLDPLQLAFGWSRATISLAAAIGIFFYGMVGPFAAAAMDHFGLRRVLLSALVVMAASSAASAYMSQTWHLIALWGVFSGIGSGAVATVLGPPSPTAGFSGIAAWPWGSSPPAPPPAI